MTMDRIEYHREGQGRGTIVCHPSDFGIELLRLRLDPEVTLTERQERNIAYRKQLNTQLN
mgnify:CR=1 FL=1